MLLERGVASASIIVGMAILSDKEKVLLRRNTSGNWEIPYGGIIYSDIDQAQNAIFFTINRILPQICLNLNLPDNFQIFPFPLVFKEKREIYAILGIILSENQVIKSEDPGEQFNSFEEGLKNGQLFFFSLKEITSLEIPTWMKQISKVAIEKALFLFKFSI
ncbi:MAG: hypothetical protein WCX74_03975 [Candidatus Paceibacterota bacterium]